MPLYGAAFNVMSFEHVYQFSSTDALYLLVSITTQKNLSCKMDTDTAEQAMIK